MGLTRFLTVCSSGQASADLHTLSLHDALPIWLRASIDLPPFLPRADGPLWPEPHSVLFDFAATAAGAEWIDDIARAAREVRHRDAGDTVVGHHDWTTAQVRFRELRATVVYDWDS